LRIREDVRDFLALIEKRRRDEKPDPSPPPKNLIPNAFSKKLSEKLFDISIDERLRPLPCSSINQFTQHAASLRKQLEWPAFRNHRTGHRLLLVASACEPSQVCRESCDACRNLFLV
jgi:hypothetical protein